VRTTQDDARENKQIKKFDLIAKKGRSNKYEPDAILSIDNVEFEVELKTSDIVKKQVSTARGVTINKINSWRNVPIWIFSQYEKPNNLTNEDYILFADQMEEFYKKLEAKIYNGSKKLIGLNEWQEARKLLVQGKINKGLLKKLDHAMNHKGAALNDPKITWKYVVENGFKIESASDLRSIVKKYLMNKEEK
jgi:hypothetical protein